jgi:hypothetical protein
MKRTATLIAAAMLATLPLISAAQDAPAPPPAGATTEPLRGDDAAPTLPPLTADQQQQVRSEMDAYRHETDARIARGEITPDEAQRLLQWREWQLAQQAAGLAPMPPPPANRMAAVPPPPYPAPPPRYYYPYPYYYPAPYYGPYYVPFGVSLCAGRAWHHGFGSFCI